MHRLGKVRFFPPLLRVGFPLMLASSNLCEPQVTTKIWLIIIQVGSLFIPCKITRGTCVGSWV